MAAAFRLQELLDETDPQLSQRELALRSGVSLMTVNSIARNRTKRVDLATLDALASVLGVEPGDLITRVPAPRTARGRKHA
jgi:DNA-binding Xre family transcriptional regulator